MEDSIQRLKRINKEKEQAALQAQQDSRKRQSDEFVQSAIFNAFQALTDAISGDTSKGQLLEIILNALDGQDKNLKMSRVEIAALKSGLATLEEEIKKIPSADLTQIPKFLQQKEEIKVSNLGDLEKLIKDLDKSIKGIQMVAEAPVVNVPKPVVNVPAPIINVKEPNLAPITKGLEDVNKNMKSYKLPEVVKTEQMNTLVSEKFDEYKLSYDEWDENDEPRVESITYLLKGKKVAKIKYNYDSNGNLTGGKRIA